jgi:hypothetical protein
MLVIAFRYLSGFVFVLIEGHWGKQFRFIPLPGTLEVVLGVSSFNCDNMSIDNMSYPHLGSLQRREQIDFEKLFQKRLHDNSFSNIIFDMSLNSH